MKVAYVSFDNLQFAKGSTTHIKNFATALCNRHSLTLISLAGKRSSFSDNGELLPAYEEIKILCPSDNFLQRTETFAREVYGILETRNFELVHYRNIWEGMAIEEFKLKKPGVLTVFECNGLPSLEVVYHYPGITQSLIWKLQAMEKKLFNLADLIITPAKTLFNYIFDSLVYPRPVALLPNGADENLFYPGNNGELKEPFKLIYVGSLTPWQGIPLAMNALSPLRNKFDFQLLCLSSPKKVWQKKLQSMAKKLKLRNRFTIKYIQHEKIPGQIRAADICIAPLMPCPRNLKQGCSPLKIFEYMACRKPIVASAIPPITDILKNRTEALLFRPGSTRAFKNSMEELFSDRQLRQNLAHNAYQRYLKNFKWQPTLEKLFFLYEGLKNRNLDLLEPENNYLP
ncbi:glycosyltransferase family 4 protein [Candidatus Riflebacteria bacterium]